MTLCGRCHCGCGKRTRKQHADGRFDARKTVVNKWNGHGAARVKHYLKNKATGRSRVAELQCKAVATSCKTALQAEMAELRAEIVALQNERMADEARRHALENIRAESRELQMEISRLEELRRLLNVSDMRELRPAPIA